MKSARGVARTLAARGLRRRAAEYGSVKNETPKVARAELGAANDSSAVHAFLSAGTEQGTSGAARPLKPLRWGMGLA